MSNLRFGYTYMTKPNSTEKSIRTRLIFVCDAMDRLQEQIEAHQVEIRRLTEQGLSQASPYWMRKDDPEGKPDQLELTHPIDSDYFRDNGTRREYIGVKPDKIKAALASIERGQRVERINNLLTRNKKRLRDIERQIGLLEIMARGEQRSFDL
ncbi:MAG: hypothetical protein H6633_16645 [Anaerolineales bacterium]|nr:hypothetical protein [Anaerolineales bacterium]